MRQAPQIADRAEHRIERVVKVAVIPAAGQSRRLGRPKQLLMRDGLTLLQQAIRTAWAAGVDHVLVVTGAAADQVRAVARTEDCRLVHNANWQDGMGSSISRAADFIRRKFRTVESVLLLPCDQPFITADHLRELTTSASRLPVTIAATVYPEGTAGIPACFPADRLDELSLLRGVTGAKRLIAAGPVRCVANPLAAIDIDTEADVTAHLQVRVSDMAD